MELAKKINDDELVNLTKEADDVFNRVSDIIKKLGSNFVNLNGTVLAECQFKLAGYKFFLADTLAELLRASENSKLLVKQVKANSWDVIIKSLTEQGVKATKDAIENEIFKSTYSLQDYQTKLESKFYNYKVKISSIDNILTAITQRIAELKKQISQV